MSNFDHVYGTNIPSEHRLEHGTNTLRPWSNPTYSFHSPIAYPLGHRRQVTSSWFSAYFLAPGDSGSLHQPLLFSRGRPVLVVIMISSPCRCCFHFFKMAALAVFSKWLLSWNWLALLFCVTSQIHSCLVSSLHVQWRLRDTIARNSSSSPELASQGVATTFKNSA